MLGFDWSSINSFQLSFLASVSQTTNGDMWDSFTSKMMKIFIFVLYTYWCWSGNSNTLVTWCKGLTHWKRSWCWERLRAGGEGDDRVWMASPTQWTWVWVDSGSWWWTGSPGVLWFMEWQRVGHDWDTELNWNVNIRNI